MPTFPLFFDIVPVLGVIQNKVLKKKIYFYLQLENGEQNPKSVWKRQFLSLVNSSTLRQDLKRKTGEFFDKICYENRSDGQCPKRYKITSICCCWSAFMVYRSKSVCSFGAATFAFMKIEGI
jgi:hypothetical protein